MSALGQSDVAPSNCDVCFNLKADIDRRPSTSAKCQQRTHASQQTASLFNHFIGAPSANLKDRLAAVSPKSIEVFHQPFATSKLLY
jgi:hypothetical protein